MTLQEIMQIVRAFNTIARMVEKAIQAYEQEYGPLDIDDVRQAKGRLERLRSLPEQQ